MKWCDQLELDFKRIFTGADATLVVRSPGRVNIIGEHTDYSDGFVLPAAIDKAAYVAVTKRDDNMICLYANAFRQAHTTTTRTLAKSDKHWPNYILGVVEQLLLSHIDIPGFNLLVDGDIPIGAGLSSSAAVECATLFALNELFALHLSKADMVHICQSAEHAFTGVKCGVMDMFASLFGKKDHVMNLDCRSLLYEYVPLSLTGYKLLLLNTNVKHQLSSSEYNTRRSQCEQGVEWVKAYHPGVQALRDVTIAMLDKYVLPKDELIYKRCRYVVEENSRLHAACEDLKRGDLAGLGEKMYATHEGLCKQFEVSCKELDFLVNAVQGNSSVLGARMMGGGFGGCTINLVKEDAIEQLLVQLKPVYEQGMHLPLSYYVASVENGTEVIRHNKQVAV